VAGDRDGAGGGDRGGVATREGGVTAWLRRRVDALSARAILAIGWLGLVAYAYPGYMSSDSVLQLVQARTGVYGAGHPPLMAVVWGVTDAIVAGPIGMLIIQVTCLQLGLWRILCRGMSPRVAALAASLLLWCPPISAVMAVIWKDSQMTGYLVLGTALLLAPRRGVRLAGLGLLGLATAMRYNALTITLPLIGLLFEWAPGARWWRRYPIALGAWLAVTLAASGVNAWLVPAEGQPHLWHESLALTDLVGTLRYAPDLPDAEVRADLAGTPLRVTGEVQRAARAEVALADVPVARRNTFGTGRYVPALWATTFAVFDVPTTAAERDAIARAWRTIVLGHLGAYLTYRWEVFRELIHLGDRDVPLAAYTAFNDFGDLSGHAHELGHAAAQSRLQGYLRPAMRWIGKSWLFRPWIYLALVIVLLPLCRRDRVMVALLASGVFSEGALFVLAPTVDFRYSCWVVVVSLVVAVMRVTMWLRSRATDAMIQPRP
jgi:hypothetical protein